MTTIHDYPASNLPADLRGDIPKDAFVSVHIDQFGSGLPGYTKDQVEDMLATADNPKGPVFETREDLDAHFDALKAKVIARRQR